MVVFAAETITDPVNRTPAKVHELFFCLEWREMTDLTAGECDQILSSLDYTKRAFQEYADYPSCDFKVQQIGDIEKLIAKVRAIRKAAKANGLD